MMKFAIKRCVDNLGRIVLPKDMRNFFQINAGDALEVIATEDGIFLKKAIEANRGGGRQSFSQDDTSVVV